MFHDDFKELIGLSKKDVLHFSSLWNLHQTRKCGRHRSLRPEVEVLILLLHLRHYPNDLLLASIFRLPRNTIWRIRHDLLDWFYEALKDRISIQTLEWRLKHSVKIFQNTYTFIVDGSEQFCFRPSNVFLDMKYISKKKKHHTINVVVVVSIDGKILYVADPRPGSINDPHVVLETRNEWYDKFDKMENGLGDSIFIGLRAHGIRIDAVTEENKKLFIELSKIRVRVENVFEEIKDWNVCKLPIRTKICDEKNMLQYHNKCWKVVAVFVNKDF